MLTIRQYSLDFNSNPQSFVIPGFDTILKVGENNLGRMAIWVSQDSTRPNVTMTFQMVEEGQNIPTLGTFIGSATIHPVIGEYQRLHEMFVWSS